jgi:hypothetical protein
MHPAMAIVMFVLLSAVLAYQSWQQSRVALDTVSAPRNEPDYAITA